MQGLIRRVLRLLIELVLVTVALVYVGLLHHWWGWVIYAVGTIAAIEGEFDFTTALVRRLRKDK